MDWLKYEIDKHFRKHVEQESIEAAAYILLFWSRRGIYIVNFIESLVDTYGDDERLHELTTLKQIIESDANIDNEDSNVQRIVHHINQFIGELETEVDYEEDGESDDGMEED